MYIASFILHSPSKRPFISFSKYGAPNVSSNHSIGCLSLKFDVANFIKSRLFTSLQK